MRLLFHPSPQSPSPQSLYDPPVTVAVASHSFPKNPTLRRELLDLLRVRFLPGVVHDQRPQLVRRDLANVGELTELATKAASDAMNIINQRFCECLGEVGRTREKRTGETTSS